MNRREAIAALMALPATARISVADVKPNDVIVIELDEHITQNAADVLSIRVGQVWPGRKCVVLGKGMRLKIASGK